MRINKIIMDYGKFEGFSKDFSKINIIYGPNESGKSTILDAIKTAIYGFNVERLDRHIYSRGRQTLTINAELTDGNENYTVERSLISSKSNNYIIEKGAKQKFSGAITLANNVLPRTFDKLFFIDEGKLNLFSSKDWGEINNDITDLISGSDYVKIEDVKKDLNSNFNSLFGSKKNSKSEYRRLLNKQDDVREKLLVQNKKFGDYNKYVNEIKRLEKNEKEKSIILVEKKRFHEKFKEIKSEKEMIESDFKYQAKEIEILKKQLQGTSEQISETNQDSRLHSILPNVSQLHKIDESFKMYGAEITEDRWNIQSFEDRMIDLPNVDENAQIDAAQKMAIEYKKIRNRPLNIAGISLATVSILILVALFLNLSILTAIAGGILILSLAIYLILYSVKQQNKTESVFLEAIGNSKYLAYINTPGDPFYNEAKKYQEYKARINVIRSKDYSEYDTCLSMYNELKTQNSVIEEFDDIDSLIRAINENEKGRKSLEKLSEKSKQIQDSLEEGLAKIAKMKEQILAAELKMEKLPGKELEMEIKVLTAEVLEINRELIKNKADLDNLKFDPDLESEEESLRQEIDALLRQKGKYDFFKTFLEKSEKEYRLENQPRYISDLSSYFSLLVPNTQILINDETNFLLSIKRDNMSIDISEAESLGTKQQIAFCARLALVNIVDKERRLPLIFDDSFVYWDFERLGSLIEKLFPKISRQIFYTTCDINTFNQFKSLKCNEMNFINLS